MEESLDDCSRIIKLNEEKARGQYDMFRAAPSTTRMVVSLLNCTKIASLAIARGDTMSRSCSVRRNEIRLKSLQDEGDLFHLRRKSRQRGICFTCKGPCRQIRNLFHHATEKEVD
ncbi:UNVERIFIED_CONTAM: hypothetical protein Sindi_1291600 [Sesamum indicum]